MDNREILRFLQVHGESSRAEIEKGLNTKASSATVKRTLSKAIDDGLIEACGNGPSTKYNVTPLTFITQPFDIDTYFQTEIDGRDIIETFNFRLITETLPKADLYTPEETKLLQSLQDIFRKNLSEITPTEYKKSMQRLGIDLSWKSSQIEGNTYSLLETERLLNEKKTAGGKTKEEAIMLLNHKDALNFILDNPDFMETVSTHKIEDIHTLLTKELDIDKNIRRHRVGITGTRYLPLDNEFQIKEALEDSCALINSRDCIFEKALLALLLLSYIQPFTDGNKRTSRIVSNAILIANEYCPLSFRTVDSIDYKKAMLIFYEQNNISAFKQIFIDQYSFAVNNYF